MNNLVAMLSGGDRRSTGRADEAVDLVLGRPELFSILVEGMGSGDPVLRMRCADAAEKVSTERPDLLLPFARLLIDELSLSTQQEVRWHVAPMLVRLPLAESDAGAVMEILEGYTKDRSAIVRTEAMQAMADLAEIHRLFLPGTVRRIEALVKDGTPAMRARGRKLLAKLSRFTEGG
jgi:hypothetical protein